MTMTKVKKGMHYCPICGASSERSIKVAEIDVLKRKAGSKFGYPYFGASIECTKCHWVGEWYIPAKEHRKCNQLYQKLIRKKENAKQKPTKFKR